MSGRWHTGNANDDGAATRGWLVGHFRDPSNIRWSEAVESKWFEHAKGDRRAEPVRDEPRTTIVLLIAGRFAIELPAQTVVLRRAGDYVMWEAGVGHSWTAEEPSTVLTVRWPSLDLPLAREGDRAVAVPVSVIMKAEHGINDEDNSMNDQDAINHKVNLASKFAQLTKPYEPGIVGYINDYKLQVVKVKGPFVWHKHDETDDFFLVIRGHLTIHLRDRDIELDPGELFVVPRGVEHCPDASEATEVLLIEPAGTINTGDAGGEMTVAPRVL